LKWAAWQPSCRSESGRRSSPRPSGRETIGSAFPWARDLEAPMVPWTRAPLFSARQGSLHRTAWKADFLDRGPAFLLQPVEHLRRRIFRRELTRKQTAGRRIEPRVANPTRLRCHRYFACRAPLRHIPTHPAGVPLPIRSAGTSNTVRSVVRWPHGAENSSARILAGAKRCRWLGAGGGSVGAAGGPVVV